MNNRTRGSDKARALLEDDAGLADPDDIIRSTRV